MTDLDTRLRAHLRRDTLPPESMQDLLAMHAAAGDADTPRTVGARRIARRVSAALRQALAWSSPSLRLALSAIVLVVLASLLYRSGVTEGERAGSHAALGARTLDEVAMNHRTRLDLDYRAPSLATLDENMELLPFSLSAPERIGENLEVVGSRYCTLAGHLAAHVKFRDAERGTPVSLFVTTLADDVERLHGQHADIAGVDVQMWQEAGLFYAMARHD